MGEPNVARLVRENEALRKVAFAAARLRRIAIAAEQVEEGIEAVWRENPDMTRSATGLIMAQQAYGDALKAFDKELLDCADVFARDPFAEDIALYPTAALSPKNTESEHD